MEAGKSFYDALKLITRLANIGDAKSLAGHPASTTHRLMSSEPRLAGVLSETIRLSIGIEHSADRPNNERLRRPANGSLRQIMSLPRAKRNAAWRHRFARHFRPAPFQLNGTGPMVGFTFDNVAKSAATAGAPILEEYGALGTFYIAGGLVDHWQGHWTGVSADEIVALHRKGH